VIKIEKKIVQQPGPQICSSKQNANQKSAALATAASTPEKSKEAKGRRISGIFAVSSSSFHS
jgi:hypothetical protein